VATVYAVGVGPGDPELLTRKAERILRCVDVILAPVSNPSEASVALGTIREFIDEARQEIVVHQFPMTSDKAWLIPAWQEAAALIATHAERVGQLPSSQLVTRFSIPPLSTCCELCVSNGRIWQSRSSREFKY
jgi:precorrin-2 methylase